MRHLPLIILSLFIFSSARIFKNNFTSDHDHPTARSIDSTRELGKKIFFSSCYACHKDSGASLAPGQTILSAMTPRAVFAALTTGKMKPQAANLSESERKAVAQFVTNRVLTETSFPKDAYTSFSFTTNPASAFDHSGWGNNLEGTGYRSTSQAGITANNVSSLSLKWAFAFPDGTVTRTKPAVAGNWLIVGGQYGEVIAINRKTGKIGWVFTASAAIRGAITVRKTATSMVAYFADFTTNVYAIDIKTGKLIWNKRAGYEQNASITGSVAVYGGKVYIPITSLEVALAANGNYACCTSSGGVVALNASNGDEVWRYRVITEPAKESGKKKNGKPFFGPSGAPVWCSPTIDAARGVLYIGTGENYSPPTTTSSDAVQAIDLKTGKLIWSFQATKDDAYNVACPMFTNCPGKGPDLDFGMAPILVKRKDGKDILVVGQKSGVVFGLNPVGGKIIWQTRIGKGGKLGGIHWGMATDGKYVYAANADNIIAIDTTESHKPSPGIYALDVNTGKLIWEAPTPPCEGKNCALANSAAPIVVPGIVFAGSLDGHIRAYASASGKILWDYNTVKEYETSNGLKGSGGAIDGPPPVVADGMLFVNSGYGMFNGASGNVLLAFEVKKN
ncbi:MAG: PQQ-binding-like beta-propeller repeat protein [Bacteroidetes bacterium]|nr:PQQ-binding-like beta-propeller repeat protein [Bacteroidota bacterium]